MNKLIAQIYIFAMYIMRKWKFFFFFFDACKQVVGDFKPLKQHNGEPLKQHSGAL